MRFGPNSCQIGILRRAVVTGNPGGRARADSYAAEFTTWASWRQMQGREIAAAGLVQDEIPLSVRVNDTPRNRTITSADRVNLRGVEYAITSVGLPDRAGGYIDLSIVRKKAG